MFVALQFLDLNVCKGIKLLQNQKKIGNCCIWPQSFMSRLTVKRFLAEGIKKMKEKENISMKN